MGMGLAYLIPPSAKRIWYLLLRRGRVFGLCSSARSYFAMAAHEAGSNVQLAEGGVSSVGGVVVLASVWLKAGSSMLPRISSKSMKRLVSPRVSVLNGCGHGMSSAVFGSQKGGSHCSMGWSVGFITVLAIRYF